MEKSIIIRTADKYSYYLVSRLYPVLPNRKARHKKVLSLTRDLENFTFVAKIILQLTFFLRLKVEIFKGNS